MKAQDTNGMVVEWAPFRMAPGATESELLEAASALQSDFLERQDGFVRRELLRGPGDQWSDLLYWRDAASATRAMAEAEKSPVCARYFSLMTGVDHADPGTGLMHFEVRKSYGR